MSAARKGLLHLFERPHDPINMSRAGGTMVYALDNDPSPPRVSTRIGAADMTPTVMAVPERLDDLGTATLLPRGTPFSFFCRQHRRAARDLCDVFMGTSSADELMQVAARVHGQVNESLFIYALSFAITRKRELRGMQLPTIVEVFPGRFVPQQEVMKAQVEANRMADDDMTPIIVEYGPDFSGLAIKPEHRLSYWREDYGINVHHWHWHLVYPIEMRVDRDRKGELFFYMHQQMIARYDIERMSLGLPRVEPLTNWRVPIPDGYFSKLTVNNSGMNYGTRQDNTLPQDFRRNDFGLEWQSINELELWRSRIFDAIHQGAMIDTEGKRVKLSDDERHNGKRGIDILGDTFEADAELSVNYLYYGDLHNIAHLIMSVAHDPDFAHKEVIGVIGDLGTTMRDPLFYRLHKFVDDVFQEYKLTQRPYTEQELLLDGVRIERAGVVRGNEADELHTGWSMREFEASRGLDFNSRPVMLRLKHLDNIPFKYHVQVMNEGSRARDVTVRVFLAPRDNVRGEPMEFMEQRILWLEMDKFTVSLKPGNNHVVRSSLESSITTTEELTFRELEAVEETTANVDAFCGCGWPQHMLVPRGRPEGMPFQLFFMLTDYAQDKVEQPSRSGRCGNGVSFCGLQDAKFPDARPMGFPWDRRPPPKLRGRNVMSAKDFAAFDNMFLHDITIKFHDTKLEKPAEH